MTGTGRFVSRAGLEVLEWPALAAAGVRALVTTRAGGTSAGPYASLNLALHVGDDGATVVENRRRAAAAAGARLEDLVFVNQVHGATVAVAAATDAGRGATELASCLADADAVVTAEAAVVLVVLAADCVPLVLVDPAAGVLAVVHAGWRGTAARVASAAVRAMEDLGADPARVLGGMGPAIGPQRYQVGDEVAAAVADGGLDRSGVLLPDGPGHWRLDLVAANRIDLAAAGVDADRVAPSPLGTGDPGPFYSDRAERPCGRHGLLATLGR